MTSRGRDYIHTQKEVKGRGLALALTKYGWSYIMIEDDMG